jgi:geranylgeranyl pyrophosphate synthase
LSQISYSEYKYALTNHYNNCIRSLLEENTKDAHILLKNCSEEIIFSNGKMHRSILALYVFLGYSKRECTDRLLEWAVSFDILQTFILMHDDIIDDAKIRRGKPVLDKRISLVIGDIFFSFGLKKFLQIDVNDETKLKALSEIMNFAIITGFGELSDQSMSISQLDKISEQAIQKVYKKKTALYSFVLPLKCAAILAGASNDDVFLMQEAGEFIGVAYQYIDDIIDFFINKENSGKTEMNDLEMNKLNIVIWESFHVFKKDKNTFLKLLHNKNTYKKLLEEHDIKNKIILKAKIIMNQGLSKIQETSLKDPEKKKINAIIIDLIKI